MITTPKKFTLHALRILRYLLRMDRALPDDPHPHASDRQRAHAVLRDIEQALGNAPAEIRELLQPLQHVLRYVIADLTRELQRDGETVLDWPPQDPWPADSIAFLEMANTELLVAGVCVDPAQADTIDSIRAQVLTILHHERPPTDSPAEHDVNLFRAAIIAKSTQILDDLKGEA